MSLVEDWARRGWKTCLELSEIELSERAELAGKPFERQPFFTLDIALPSTTKVNIATTLIHHNHVASSCSDDP